MIEYAFKADRRIYKSHRNDKIDAVIYFPPGEPPSSAPTFIRLYINMNIAVTAVPVKIATPKPRSPAGTTYVVP
jgi:hypothetical protein